MRRLLLVILLWVGVLAVSSAVGMAIGKADGQSDSVPWLIPAVTHSAMLVLTLSLIASFARGQWARFGFNRYRGKLWGTAAVGGAGVGIVSSLALGLITHETLPGTERFTFWQIVLFIWIWAAICEEMFLRGLIQGLLFRREQGGDRQGGGWLSVPVIFAAVLFGLMHMGLLSMGMSGKAVVAIALFAVVLGALAGVLRERSGSVAVAIATHMAANIGGSMIDYLVT